MSSPGVSSRLPWTNIGQGIKESPQRVVVVIPGHIDGLCAGIVTAYTASGSCEHGDRRATCTYVVNVGNQVNCAVKHDNGLNSGAIPAQELLGPTPIG